MKSDRSTSAASIRIATMLTTASTVAATTAVRVPRNRRFPGVCRDVMNPTPRVKAPLGRAGSLSRMC